MWWLWSPSYRLASQHPRMPSKAIARHRRPLNSGTKTGGSQVTTKSESRPDVLKVENGRLIVDVALDGTEVSASGKSISLFSTRGNLVLGDGVVVGINAYRKR